MSLSPTISSENDPIPMECDSSYDSNVELAKYIIQATYLLLNIILNLMVLRVLVFSKNHKFRESPFFMIYAADLIIGIYMSLSEIFIGRLFIYITPLCPILTPYFFYPSMFLKIFFTLTHYSQGFKTISQVFLSFNRMTSVIFPVSYYKSWKTIQMPSIVLLFVLPIGVIWNVVISRVYINPSSGGFSVNYIRKVAWASLSKFHLAYFAVSLALIVILSGMTLYGLFVMKTRLKKAETSITVATMVISLEFSLLAMFQIYFAFFSSTTSAWRPFLLRALDFTYDFLNLSTTIIFIAFNQQLRTELFKSWSANNSPETSRHSSTKITVPVVQSIWKTPSSQQLAATS